MNTIEEEVEETENLPLSNTLTVHDEPSDDEMVLSFRKQIHQVKQKYEIGMDSFSTYKNDL